MPQPAQASQIDIVNMSLGHLKQRKITAMTDATVQADEANAWYEICRRETLRGHDWGFANSVVALAANSTYLQSATLLYAGQWLYAYTYPSNAVAVWHVYNEATIDKDRGEDFRELYDSVNNTKVILANIADALGEYTVDLSDVTLFDANFVIAFSYVLAARMAPALTGDDNIADGLLKKSQVFTSEAERMSSYEAQATANPQSDYEKSRG